LSVFLIAVGVVFVGFVAVVVALADTFSAGAEVLPCKSIL